MTGQAALKPWGPEERAAWFADQEVVRNYKSDVVRRLEALQNINSQTAHKMFKIEQYGALTHNPDAFPLYRVTVGKWWSMLNPSILITGGVHGYEKGGVDAALAFLETKAEKLSEKFNILVYPCISPQAYENQPPLEQGSAGC